MSHVPSPISLCSLFRACVALAALAPALHAQPGAKNLPSKYSGPPTTAEITAGDLMTRLYAFADDSMLGRRIGELGSIKSTNYLSWELQRVGLRPAGDHNGFFQVVATYRGDYVARNVVGVVRGSDPVLRDQYIVIGAHSDHIGSGAAGRFDHDSVRAHNQIMRPAGAESPNRPPTADERARIRAATDSLHKLHPARIDSVFNGADDDGSGTVSVLEIAEAFAMASSKPKRSILFVLHVGEEGGMIGSTYFTDHPTVPRVAIVAELNLDMVGRGGASDVTGHNKDGTELHGGRGYLQLVGTRRLSAELGDLIEAVNTEEKLGFTFDYSLDANGHPQQIYCRSDHYEYARLGIPIAFFTTGGHADYHQLTDEPQYIDYGRIEQVSKLVYETALRLANLDHRLVVDKAKAGGAACRQ